MKRRSKIIIGLLVVCAAALVGAGCSSSSNPYNGFNKTGHEISVFYDSNGGHFSTSEDSNLVDTFPKDAFNEGKLKLLAPGDPLRGYNSNGEKDPTALNRSKVTRSGYLLAGWYKTREPRVDADGNMLDDYGEITTDASKQGWIYNDKWDFGTDYLEIDVSKKYDSNKPVMTLWAGWIPEFVFSMQVKDGEEWTEYDSAKFNPVVQPDGKNLAVPTWGETSVDYGSFPQLSGKTFEHVYSDETLNNEITDTLVHDGSINYERGIAVNPVKKFYTTWRDGVWFKISTAQQFVSNSRLDGCYEIVADELDFEGVTWYFDTFEGKIVADKQVVFKNITINQSGTQENGGGLFKIIGANAEFKNITFDNVIYNMEDGSRIQGATFGLFAGNINENAKFENVTVNGSFNVGNVYALYAAGDAEKTHYSGYRIGLLNGNTSVTPIGITYNIQCTAVEVNGTIPCKVEIDGAEVRISANAQQTD